VKDRPPTPAAAIDALGVILHNHPVLVDPMLLSEDLVCLRKVFPDDADFISAVLSVGTVIVQACVKGVKCGTPLQYQLQTWHRVAFSSRPGRKSKADLRLVFRPTENGTIEILAFGHRHKPYAVYLSAKARSSPEGGSSTLSST
jgi:hypothetical protein